jgi:bla regulator protein BlaR1
MIAANLTSVANHLWQSTLFAAAAGLLSLASRKQPAQVRYGLWLAASVKFLVPFALLISLGSQFELRTPSITQSRLPAAMEEISQPFASSSPAPLLAMPVGANRVSAVLFVIWACGVVFVVFSWLVRWRHVRAAVRAAAPSPLAGMPVKVISSPVPLEPGVFGILRPVLLLPDGILERLTRAQLEAILKHELCHVRRRDNLAAAVHMTVEALFWFHPLVWWIGSRLMEERERACDEEVLRDAAEPEVYAEGILNVCKFYLASPLRSVSGVTGSNLKKRIEEIMTRRSVYNLSRAKKLVLASAGVIAVGLPVAIGILNAPAVRAQSDTAQHLAFEVTSVRLNKSSDFRNWGFDFLPGGRFKATNLPLDWVIAEAYHVPPWSVRISGGPEWIGSERYDIEATAAPGAISQGLSVKAREDKMRLMLRTLLADRFKLAMRQESKDLPVYVVVVAKNGPKLQRAKIEEKDCPAGSTSELRCHVINGGMGRGMHGKAVEISDILSFVENWSDRPMVDKTGLTGLFEVETDGWAPMRPRVRPPGEEPTAEDKAMADPIRPTLFTIFERLGLKMESQKAPVDVFAIDHVERPSEN